MLKFSLELNVSKNRKFCSSLDSIFLLAIYLKRTTKGLKKIDKEIISMCHKNIPYYFKIHPVVYLKKIR